MLPDDNDNDNDTTTNRKQTEGDGGDGDGDYDDEGEEPYKEKRDRDIVWDPTTQQWILDPYNPVNTFITPTDVLQLLQQYDGPTRIHNFALYARAFVHPSYVTRPAVLQRTVHRVPLVTPLFPHSYERLEYLGDGVLELVTKHMLYRRFPKADPSFLSIKKITLVNNESIGKIAADMGLVTWLLLSKHWEPTRLHFPNLGCLFESFLGAMYLDQPTEHALPVVARFVERVFALHVDWIDVIQSDRNYKTLLQQQLHTLFRSPPPVYRPTTVRGEIGVYLCVGQPHHGLTHEQSTPLHTYSSIADIQNEWTHTGKLFVCLGTQSHGQRIKAEQLACKHILEHLDHMYQRNPK